MRMTGVEADVRDLTGGQAARLLRDGRLGDLLLRRAAAQADRHRAAVGDQAEGLRRAVLAADSAQAGGSSRASARGTEGAAA